MTKNYYTNTSSNLKIPSREEFHRFASNELSSGDFCTNYPSGYQIDRVAKAIRWTIANDKGRNKRKENNS